MSLPRPPLFTRTAWTRSAGVAEALRTETVGGAILLAAALAALLWANSPWGDAYETILGTTFGPASLHLDLEVREWTADGLLAIFFLVAGIELKQELVHGDLRRPADAAVPVVAACCGVVVPALVYLAVTWSDPGARAGWAVPVATDIAFALAVLAVVGRHLPGALRVFLLTLAVVDDIIGITIIAVGYADDLDVAALAGALATLAAYAVLARTRQARWWLLVPLGLATWTLVHASGVHATVAGVLLGIALPVTSRDPAREPLADRVEHVARPFSAGVAVPLFALGAAGVALDGDTLRTMLDDVVVPGVVLGLVLGKTIGIFGGTYVVARLTSAKLADEVRWVDVLGVSMLAGVGFTVSLLIGELAFEGAGDRTEHVRFAVLAGSLLAALPAVLVLRRRNAAYRAEARERGA